MINPAECDLVKCNLYAREVEKRFCQVYGYVIWHFDFQKDLICGAKEVLNSKKKKEKFNSYQLDFLLSFGVQDTCLSARKFYESIMNNPKIMKKLSGSNPIKLLCLESESLPTVIGVCQVINEIVKKIGSESKCDLTEIRILVIDNREEWKHLCGYITDTANSYFTNIEIKLDSVEDFVSWSFQEFNDRIKQLDFFIIARFFTESRIFNYNLIRIVLNEMKEDAILFYFDSCNKKFYENLKELSKTLSFSQVMNCQSLQASFKDLGNKHSVELLVSWDKDYQPIMFSTWIKDFAVQNDSFTEVAKPIKSNELDPIKPEKKSNNLETLALNKDISNSKITDTSTSGQTNVAIGEKNVNQVIKPCNEFDTQNEQVNLVNEKEKVKSPKQHVVQSNCHKGQKNEISGIKEVKTSMKHSIQSDSSSKNTDVVSEKKKTKSSTKHSNVYISTIEKPKTSASKAKKESDTQKSHQMLDNILSILNKQAFDSRAAEPPQTSKCSNVPRDVGDQARMTKQTGSGKIPPPVLTASVSQKKKGNSAEIKSKKNANSESTASKKFKTKSVDKQAPTTTSPEVQPEKTFLFNLPKKSSMKNAALTKKASKNNPTEKIKLTGKFARMDLEKKNKDERHKMRAKKASFAKHANFDYDD